MGVCTLWAGGHRVALGGARGRSGIADCIGRVWRPARCLPARRADEARKSEWCDCGHGLRLRGGNLSLEMVARAVYMVGSARNDGDVWRGIRRESCAATVRIFD